MSLLKVKKICISFFDVVCEEKCVCCVSTMADQEVDRQDESRSKKIREEDEVYIFLFLVKEVYIFLFFLRKVYVFLLKTNKIKFLLYFININLQFKK
jgi:hypothetical protein